MPISAAFVRGSAPILSVEFARRTIPADVRPTFQEMEQFCKNRDGTAPAEAPAPAENGEELLVRLAPELGKIPNTILIEGHTDAAPYSGAYTNWELSTDRANSARRNRQTSSCAPQKIISP